MNKLVFYIFFISFSAFSQKVSLDLDTNLLRIGEHLSALIECCDADSLNIDWNNADSLFNDFEILQKTNLKIKISPDTCFYKNYILTSFDTGSFLLPELPLVIVDNDTFFTNLKIVDFLPVQVDSLNMFFDNKPIKKIPFKLIELWYYKYYLLILLCIVLFMYLFFRYFLNKKEVKVSKYLEPDIPIDIYFLNKISVLNSKKYLKSQQYKKFYTELSDILRGYLELRFDIPALESSSSDLKNLLKQIDCLDDWLNEFLRISDLVKFAKGLPEERQSQLFCDSIKLFIKKHGVVPVLDVNEKTT